MRDQKRKRHNALKHGAFTKVAILPGEDPQGFELLHAALIEEWVPIGPTEEDAVLSIAKCMWRKIRLQNFIKAKIVGCSYDPDHVAFNRVRALREISKFIEPEEPDNFKEALECLHPEDAKHLREKFYRDDFETSSEFARAVQNEIISVLLPKAERTGNPPVEVIIDRSEKILTQEAFDRELTVDDRIDSTMDRAIKRLIQIKTMKQLLNSNSLNGPGQPQGAESGKTKLSKPR